MKVKKSDFLDENRLNNLKIGAINPLQLSNWGRVKKVQNWEAINLEFWESNLIGTAMILLKKIPKTSDYLAFVPFGPCFSIDIDFMKKREAIESLAQYLKEECSVKLLKIHEYEDNSIEWEKITKKSFKMLYSETYIIDLELDEESLLMNLHKKLRNEIKKGVKNGTKIVKMNNKEGLDLFYDLHKETFDRSDYEALGKDFFESVYTEYVQLGNGNLFLAFADEVVISGAIIIESSNTALYMWGASTGDKQYNMFEGQKVLLWESILEAKRNGKKYFDLGGVTSNAEKGTKREGIYIFKKKFGGEHKVFSGTYNFYLGKIKGRIYDVLLKVYLSGN